MSNEAQQPRATLTYTWVARALSGMVSAVLDRKLDASALVKKLRQLADHIEANASGGPPAAKKTKKPKKEAVASELVREIFDFWKETMGSPASILTEERVEKIEERVREGYGPDMLRQAIVGCSRTPHNMGTAPGSDGRKFNGLDVIFRNGANLERFAASAGAAPIIGRKGASAENYDPREHGDLGHLGGQYAQKWNLLVDVGPDRYESEWSKRSGA